MIHAIGVSAGWSQDEPIGADAVPLKILLVEDSAVDAELIERELRRAGMAFEARRVETEKAMRAALAQSPPDIILCDYTLPRFDGLAALALNRELCPQVPFVFLSGSLGEETLIECVKRGARDYVLKNNLARLPHAIERALREAGERTKRMQSEQKLRKSEVQNRLLARLVEQTGDAILSMDLDGVVRSWNKGAAALYGFSAEEAIGKSVRVLQGAHLGDAEFQAVLLRIRTQETYTVEGPRRTNTGKTVHVMSNHTPLFDEAGVHIGQVSVGRDITERKRQEERIARLMRIQAVMSGINAAIVRLRDRKELFLEACRVANEEGGFPIAWIAEVSVEEDKIVPIATAGFDAAAFASRPMSLRSDVVKGHGTTGRALREKRIAFDNDVAADPAVGYTRAEVLRRGYHSVVSVPFVVGDRAVAVMTLYATERDFFDAEELRLLGELAADVSFALDHIEKEEKLNYLAFYDSLTGLPNRGLFLDRLRQRANTAKRDSRPLGVVLLDLERFRVANSTLGRAAGDELIKTVARRLETALPDPDIVARVGGDQFAIVLRDVRQPADIAHRLDGRIVQAFAPPVAVAGSELTVSWKAGIAMYPVDGEDSEALLEHAESALKSAKSSGERYRFFTSQMSARVAERLELESRLRQALAKREFVLHYQPKLGLASGRIEGVEALIRWNDPRTGLVPPLKFIPLLEETGMIVEAGAWVIEEAAAQYRRWAGQRLRAPRIAVNVSQFQLRQADFVSVLQQRAGSNGGVDIEITESLLMEDISSALLKLESVKQAGFGIAIDDFGTGYSSLAYLVRLPVDTLKIDRAFIKDMLGSPANMSVVSTIIQMAHGLNLKVVAEGVETEEQKKILTLLRCDQMQGYLFSPPVPAEKLEPLLAADGGPSNASRAA